MKIKLTEDQIKILFTVLKEQTDFDTELGKISPTFNKLLQLKNTISPGDNETDNTTNSVSDDSTNTEINPTPEIASNTTTGLFHPLNNMGKITSNYGDSRGNRSHKGIDIAIPSGSKVYSPANGTIIEAKDTSPNGCGGFIKIDHGNFETKFCHLKKWLIKKGDIVKKGQVIGLSGGGINDPYRGDSSGSHLHYEIVNSSGISVNPLKAQKNLTA